MPALPRIQIGSNGVKSYGRNAIRADGSLDPDSTFNVSLITLDSPLTDEQLLATFSQGRPGYTFAPPSPLPSPRRGATATFHETEYSLDGEMRTMMFGNVMVVALYAGDVGSDGMFFLESFGAAN
jgi:hypothetical protein